MTDIPGGGSSFSTDGDIIAVDRAVSSNSTASIISVHIMRGNAMGAENLYEQGMEQAIAGKKTEETRVTNLSSIDPHTAE